MSTPRIIDAHLHLDPNSKFYTPEPQLKHLLKLMDRLSIRHAVCTDHLSMYEGAGEGLRNLKSVYEESGGRVYYLGVYHPGRAAACMKTIEEALLWPGFAGLKIHPSFHGISADDPLYEPVWKFASEHDLAILTHSWSVSDYNPAQTLSTPGKFERYIDKYRNVRLVLAHAGGRGNGRHEAIRLINQYENVYTDIAGDIFCYRLIESLTGSISPDKILFGSDFPWLDPRANLARVMLTDMDNSSREKILRENALKVYKIGNE